jgi:hypothetical protein
MAEDMRPLSMDDYTDTEFTGQKKKPLIERLAGGPYRGRKGAPLMQNIRALGGRAFFAAIGDDDAVMDAFNISREVADNLKFKDNDKTEDTLRHILLGGLVESEQGQAFIADREGEDKESKIDNNNNLFGAALRKKYPDKDSFIQAAIATAVAVGEGNMKNVEELDGLLPRLSMGSPGDFQKAMPPMIEDNEAPIPQNMPEPDPMKATDDYTVTQRKGGIMKAQKGTMPLTEKTSPPTGNKPINPVPITNPIGRPKQPESDDPRDMAIAKLENALMKKNMPTKAKKGTVKIDEELKEGTKPKDSAGVAVMIGLGAPEIDYSKGEEGDPPPGATKKEIADDQMVLLSEGELVVPANVVRFHGLATYEGMRREALTGLQAMESDGQISYITEGKTKKTRQGGIMKAQQGIIPLPGQQYTPTYQQPIVEAASSQFITTPEGTQVYTPSVTQQALATPVNPQVTPVYTQTPGLVTRVVAPNIGYFLPEDQRLSYMRPDAPPSGFVPAPGVPITPPDDPTPDPIIDDPEQPKPAEPTPDPISEEAEKYIESGAGQQEIANVANIEQASQTARDMDFADASARMQDAVLNQIDNPTKALEFNLQSAKESEAYKALTSKTFEKDLNTQVKKIGKDASDAMAKLFGPPTGLGAKTGVPYSDQTILKSYRDMAIADMPSAFLESIRNPQVAATRKVDAFGNRLYQPGLEDISAISQSTGMSEAAVKKYYNIPDDYNQQYGTYSKIDPLTGRSFASLTPAQRAFSEAYSKRREDASDRRTERAKKNAQDSGFASQGINQITQAELDAHSKINMALNDGQYDPNGLMGVEQYADFKKTGLQLKDFFKLSRAEQSFYAAARTGDTVESWVIDSMKQGTTAAFDAMNKANDSNVLRDDKYEIQSNNQTKPADAKGGFEVNPITYWQSEEGKKKAKELGVEVG